MSAFDIKVAETVDASNQTDDEAVYANQEQADDLGKQTYSIKGDSSDEVDPRKLYRDPTLSEIRWYYRRTFAKVLVDKPIEDAFKNGFDFVGDGAARAEELLDQPRYGVDKGFVDAYQMAQKKARRDGFALLYIGTKDNTAGTHVSPISNDDTVSVDEISHVKVLRIDDLSTTVSDHQDIQDGTGLDSDQYAIRETGIVVNTDIESPNYREPIGYVLDGGDEGGQFIHKDRVLHYTWNPEVDGNYEGNRVARFRNRNTTLGEYEGDSVLIPSYDIIKGVAKSNWALAQTIFRGASHLYSVTLPEDADEDDREEALNTTRNINAKSALVWPHGYEDEQHESGNELDPSPHYEALFNQVCAVHEMTKSVLFGTQAGTVSGSEVDIKNYFNKVERFRTRRGESDIRQYLTRATRMLDGRTNPDYEYENVEVEWGPMFKVDSETRLGMLQTQAQAIGTLIGQYVITPDEARELLTEEWAQIDYSELTQDQMDVLDRINLAQVGRGEYSEANDPSPDQPTNPRQGGQEGGRPEGSRQAPEASGATPTGTDEGVEA